MRFSLSDLVISQFLSGLFAVAVLLIVGFVLSFTLKKLAARYPFTRLALVLALTPLCLVQFLERGGTSTFYLYAMIVLLLGITIDGINYLLLPKEQEETAEVTSPATSNEATPTASSEQSEEERDPGVIVWERAE